MMKVAVEEYNKRLIEYAEKETQKLGNMILASPFANSLDRTGNLLNSLCWGVTYKGKMVGSGYFREAVTRPKGLGGSSSSYLHEFFPNDAELINGRQLASEFLQSYKGKQGGWDVFFAILAPYWGYWETGFKMKSGGGTVYKGFGSQERSIPRSSRFMRFQVMIHAYDDVRWDLKPSSSNISVYVPKYSFRNTKYKNKRGYVRIGVER